jgi:hypothetical protein
VAALSGRLRTARANSIVLAVQWFWKGDAAQASCKMERYARHFA